MPDRHQPLPTGAQPAGDPPTGDVPARVPPIVTAGTPVTDHAASVAALPPADLSKRLSAHLAHAILDTPGVVRLEPALKDALRRLSFGTPTGPNPVDQQPPSGPANSVRLTLAAGTVAAVVDITITAEHPALTTARNAQHAGLSALTDVLTEPTAVSLTVNILGIE